MLHYKSKKFCAIPRPVGFVSACYCKNRNVPAARSPVRMFKSEPRRRSLARSKVHALGRNKQRRATSFRKSEPSLPAIPCYSNLAASAYSHPLPICRRKFHSIAQTPPPGRILTTPT